MHSDANSKTTQEPKANNSPQNLFAKQRVKYNIHYKSHFKKELQMVAQTVLLID